jgi:subtilisin-like proprotein convertase family protein
LENQAPKEFEASEGLQVAIPLPDGSVELFEMWYSPVAETELLQKYPAIRSYKGISPADHSIMRMTVSPIGWKAMIKTKEGQILIDPIVQGQSTHASYYVKDFGSEILSQSFPKCGVVDSGDPLENLDFGQSPLNLNLRSGGDAISLRTFRAAIAATGEWTLREGGKANAIAKIMASIDRANIIFESEVGFRLILVANNDLIVFDDPDADPYLGGVIKSAPELINSNTAHVNRIIGIDNYDIGHVFTRQCADNIGGLARTPCVCVDAQKAAATTCWATADLETNVVRIMAHEMAHQFGAKHTFNLCDRDNENLPTGYEPGSGSTIMSYAGSCGVSNIQAGSDDYYHCNSLQVMFSASRTLACGGEIATSNTRPDANFTTMNGLTIPINTPFFVEGSATDDENDFLSYSVEQHDNSLTSCTLGQPMGSCPSFRSIPPSGSNHRVFPGFPTIWSNATFTRKNEVLPSYSRDLTFVFIARDNNSEVGAFDFDTMSMSATDEAGPFEVEYPNAGEDQTSNKHSEIVWDVANTDGAEVNCQKVDILLYNSSDFNDYRVLKTGTENDGNEWVLMPDEELTDVRIMVRASENVFFDISNQNFDILNSVNAGYSLAVSPNSGSICLPGVFTTNIESSSFGGYQGNIDLDITDGLPVGATFNFGSSTIEASESTSLEIDLSNVSADNNATIEVQAIGALGDTMYRYIQLEITRSDFSALTTVSPEDGTQGVAQSVNLSWNEIPDADSYDVELATSPSFDMGSLVESFSDVSGTSVSPSQALDKNEIYFWRVRANNSCEQGDYTAIAAFSTEAASCTTMDAPDKEVMVPKGKTTEFYLDVNLDAELTDVNVANLDFFCDFLQDAKISLVSPTGTEVILADKVCGNTTDMLCGFDDQASSNIKCPPNNGAKYRPQGMLSNFNGENANGRWTLKLNILNSAVASELGEWSLEFCSNTVLNAPYLVANDTFKTKTSENNPLSRTLLRTDDANNTDGELTYTLLATTSQGELLLNGMALGAGSVFTQEDINSGALTYNNTGGINALDAFTFIVDDGEGGWTGSHDFIININEDFPSGVQNLSFETLFKLFPNPSLGAFNIVFEKSLSERLVIDITDVKGRLIDTRIAQAGATSMSITLDHSAPGIYIVKGRDSHRIFSEKLTIQ